MMRREGALKQRYPEIDFFLSFFPYRKVKLSKDPNPFCQWLSTQNLEEIEVLYIVGLIGFALPVEVKEWLKQKKERVLLFIEDELGAFASFSYPEILDHPQIHLHYAREDPIEELAQTFPVDRLAIYVPRGKQFDALTLQRRSAAFSALYSDVLYSHILVRNVLTNYRRLPHCFAANQWAGSFKNIPAIICGAGPSLEKTLPFLRDAQERALLIAGGSTITILTQNGIQPHLAMALDPNQEEYERLKQSSYFVGPFLFAPRLHRDVFATAGGPFGFLQTDTGGQVEGWLEQTFGFTDPPIGPDLGSEAFSVTTLAVGYAYALGCNPIIFTGVDLAYSGGKRYAKGVEAEPSRPADPRALEKILLRKDVQGKEVETLLKWVMEADAISAFAKSHPETLFLNATEGGLGFTGIENLSLQNALAQHAPLSRDLSGLIHQKIQLSPLSLDEKKFPEIFAALETSLTRCSELCKQITRELEVNGENGKTVLWQTDLAEEIAYHCFLEGIDAALSRVLLRYYPHLDPAIGKRMREIAKYRELQVQMEKLQDSLRASLPSVIV